MNTDRRQKAGLPVMVTVICMLLVVFAASFALTTGNVYEVATPQDIVEVLPPEGDEEQGNIEHLYIPQGLKQPVGNIEDSSRYLNNPDVKLGQDPPVAIAGVSLNSDERKLLEVINASRVEAGVSQLRLDEKITEQAKLKAKDLVQKGYLSYNSPAYGNLQDMLKKTGVDYPHVKQKIARTSLSLSVELAHRALMRYDSHRSDLLNDKYDVMGLAVLGDGQSKYIVQILAGGSPEPVEPDPQPEPTLDPQPEPEPEPDPPVDSGETGVMNTDEKQMLELVNKERVKRGLQPLQADSTLVKLGRLKARDMINKGYFSHTSPTYGSPFEMMKKAGVQYSYAGENLAKAWSVNSAHNGLMNSSGHRANILNTNFNRVGIAIVQDGNYKYCVQMFIRGQGGGSVPQPEPDPSPVPNPQPQPKPEPVPQPNPGNTQGLTEDEKQMLNLVNKERSKLGIPQLRPNLELTKVARIKAKDMINKGYFSHTSPTYGSPFDMMRQFGIRYSYAGENLAGAPTVSMAHTNLMNSSGHRKNILNQSYDEVGIGIINDGPYGKMFVQMFIG